MSRDLNQLLQECLARLDRGMTPDECLSAWPEQRVQLEPMLRQALLLRVAFASAPSEDFRARAKDSLMFAAGREAREALEAAPDEHFVQTTRQRLINTAGAQAQETLRAVAPPRLPFWVNARRRFLEAAATRPASAPASRQGALAFRSGLSAAVVVLAIAVAGLAYFTTSSPQPSVSAELAAIDAQLRELEEQAVAGNPVPATAVVDLSRRAAAAVDKLGPESSPTLTNKASDLIPRLKEVAQQTSDDTAVQQATQQLVQAEEKVDRIFAARVPDTVVVSTPVATKASNTAVPGQATAVPTANASSASAGAAAATPEPTVGPLGPNDIRMVMLTTDEGTYVVVTTERLRVVFPAGWSVPTVSFATNGIGKLESPRFRAQNSNASLILNIELSSSDIIALIDGVQVNIRTGGKNISTPDLVVAAPRYALELNEILESVVFSAPPPPATSTPTASPSPKASQPLSPGP